MPLRIHEDEQPSLVRRGHRSAEDVTDYRKEEFFWKKALRSQDISDAAKGDSDIPSVVKINFIPEMPEHAKRQLKRYYDDLELTKQFFSFRAQQEVQKKINQGELTTLDDPPAHRFKREAYRGKVYEYLMDACSWLSYKSTQDIDRSFSVKKAEFHLTLIKAVLEGLLVPRDVFHKLEELLKAIGDSIMLSLKDDNAKQRLDFIFTVFHYDEALEIVIPSIRSVRVHVANSVKQFVSTKSSVTWVNLSLQYMQKDVTYTEAIFEGKNREKVKAYLGDAGDDIFEPELDIEVDDFRYTRERRTRGVFGDIDVPVNGSSYQKKCGGVHQRGSEIDISVD